MNRLALALLASQALAAPVIEKRQLGGLPGLPVAGALPNLPIDGLPIVGGLSQELPGGVLDHHKEAPTPDVDPIVDNDVVTEDPSEKAADKLFEKAFAQAAAAAAGTSSYQSTKDLNDAVAGVQATNPSNAAAGPINNSPLGGLGGLTGGLGGLPGGLRRRQLGGLGGLGGIGGGDDDQGAGPARGGDHGDHQPEPVAFALENLVTSLLNTLTTILPGMDGEQGEEGGPGGPGLNHPIVDSGEGLINKRQLGGPVGGLGGADVVQDLVYTVLDLLLGVIPGAENAGPFSDFAGPLDGEVGGPLAVPGTVPVGAVPVAAPAAVVPIANNRVAGVPAGALTFTGVSTTVTTIPTAFGRPTVVDNTLVFPGTAIPANLVVPTSVPALARPRIVQRDVADEEDDVLPALPSPLSELDEDDDAMEKRGLGDDKTISNLLNSITGPSSHKKNATTKANKPSTKPTKSILKRQEDATEDSAADDAEQAAMEEKRALPEEKTVNSLVDSLTHAVPLPANATATKEKKLSLGGSKGLLSKRQRPSQHGGQHGGGDEDGNDFDPDVDVDYDRHDHPEAIAYSLEGLVDSLVNTVTGLLPGVEDGIGGGPGGDEGDDEEGEGQNFQGAPDTAAPAVVAPVAPVAAPVTAPAVAVPVVAPVAAPADPVVEPAATTPAADAQPQLDSTPLDSTGLDEAANALPL